MKTKKTFVVTGGAGFIGSHLTRSLLEEGYSVKVVDNLCNERKGFLQNFKDNFDFHNIDILEKSKLKNILNDTDGIFHQAALISAKEPNPFKNEYCKVNVKGTKNIFLLAKELELKVIFASSASIYGEVQNIPIKENQEKKPLGIYGETKLQCEELAQKYVKEGTKIIGLRYFNVYGEGQSNNYAGVITTFLNQIKTCKDISIFGDGFQRRDFIFVGDVVKANILAMKKNIDFALMNIGSGKSISILELARMILKISGLNLEINFHKHENFGVFSSEADINLAKNLLGWRPETRLKDWIRQMML